MEPTLVHLFRHNRWANLRLLEACAELDPATLSADPDGGTFGSIAATLVHLLAAEERYVALLRGEAQPEPPLRESEPFPGFDRLRARARRSGTALVAVAQEDPHERVLRGTRGDRPYEMSAVIPLVQAIHHGNEHRTQITSLLGRLGIEPPDLSGWGYRDAEL